VIRQTADSLIEPKPAPPGSYGALPKAALDPKRYVEWSKDFADWVVRTQSLQAVRRAGLKLLSEPGETERDFRIRVQQAGREARDGAVERCAHALHEGRAAERESSQGSGSGRARRTTGRRAEASDGGVVRRNDARRADGRRTVSLSTLGRATTAARGVGRSMKESQDVDRARVKRQEAEAEAAAIEAEPRSEIAGARADRRGGAVRSGRDQAKRAGVDLRLVALAWQPN